MVRSAFSISRTRVTARVAARVVVFGWVMAADPAGALAGEAVAVRLDYQADRALGNCPSASAFEEEVARQLGRDPFRAGGGRTVVVRLLPHPPGIGGRIEWRDVGGELRGERTFWSRDESCAQLARAIALATAIQIQLLETAGEGGEDGRIDASPERPPAAPAPAGSPSATGPPAAVTSPGPAPPQPSPTDPGAIDPNPREPWMAVDAGVGVVQDLGDAPAMVLPRIAVSVGRPASFNLRLAASGFGPGADVTRPEGSAHIDRFFVMLAVVRSFRVGRALQPSLGLGGGWQGVQVRGTSAMPTLAQAHDPFASSWVLTASGGLAFVLAPRLALVLEVESFLYRPSITVQVGSGHAARLDGVALFAHGGLLARF